MQSHMKCFEEKLSQAGQKNIKILVLNLFTQTHVTVLNIINCCSKLPIKIKKEKTRKTKEKNQKEKPEEKRPLRRR